MAGQSDIARARIAIVGSGPSALYAIQALLRAERALDIEVFEAGRRAGVGVPYDRDHTHRAMLANIASIELPPLGPKLSDWLNAQSDDALQRIGVARAAISERAFFPRIALGAYFHAALKRMAEEAAACGHQLRVYTRSPVVDIGRVGEGIAVTFRKASGKVLSARFDFALIATGHSAPKSAPNDQLQLPEAYSAVSDAALSGSIGVLGASLSAIDVAVALAAAHGAFFRNEAGALRYARKTDFHVTLMSRGGILPEADFYCPIPYEPLKFLKLDMPSIARGQAGLLDHLFSLLRRELQHDDPDYARAIDLERLQPETFGEAYFRARRLCDPFVWAARNLDEVKSNAANKKIVRWRYCILRAHEVFAAAVPFFSRADKKRFDAGLKSAFIDNYAAVPPESIERLLALHDADCLSVKALGEVYSAAPATGGGFDILLGEQRFNFDHLIDARGQSNLGIDALPFPSLRLALQANRLRGARENVQSGNVNIEAHYRLAAGLNPLDGLYFLSMPFLLHHNPFVQGLCSAREMAEIAVAHILQELHDAHAPDIGEAESLKKLRDALLLDTQPIFCLDGGSVILT